MVSTHYSVLGVSPNASSDEIKRQFKKLAVKYHPDKTDDVSHHEMFLQINKAYETLRDEDRRKEYDVKNGIYATSSMPAGYSDAYNTNFKSHHGFSYYSPGKSYGGGSSYFSFFQRNYQTYTDAARNHFESHERPNQHNDAAAAAAKLAQKKMEEDLKRRRQEQMYEAQRQKQEAERRQREKRAREKIEEQLREQKARVRMQHEQMKEAEYQRYKADAHRRQWEAFYEVDESETDDFMKGDNSQGGGGKDEPIVIDDEGETSDSFEDCQASPPGSGDKRDNTFTGEADDAQDEPSSQYFKQERGTHSALEEPEVVEVNAPDEEGPNQQRHVDEMSGPASPKRAQYEEGDEIYKEASAQKKPARDIDMSNLRLSLGTSIDDTNFKDMLDSLPQSFSTSTGLQKTNEPSSPGKTRKTSSSVHRVPNKRARYDTHFEGFTDGRTRAETLHTPVNKAPSRRNNSINITDLSPEFDERKLMFTTQPPTINMTSDLTTEMWLQYTRGIHEYERGFAAFRTAVLEHQRLRLQKDERHHDTIYDDTTCLDAFLSCLFNDLLILQNYGRALQEFRNVVKTFRHNCELKREIEARENTRI